MLEESTGSGSQRKIIQLKTQQRAVCWPWDEDQSPASSSFFGVFRLAEDGGDSMDVARRRKGSLQLQAHG